MNICPECEKFIHGLILRKAVCKSYFMEEHKNKIEKSDTPFLVIKQYICPECDELLFEDEDEAKDFLDKI